jgi:hypothetical protein
MRVVVPFVVLLLLVGFNARGPSVGFAVPLLGVITVTLVVIDRRAPRLRAAA